MADTSIGKAYVQIVPTAKGITNDMEGLLSNGAEKSGKSAGNSFGSSMMSTLKKVVVAAGIGKMFVDTLNAGADLQQSFGGLDTLYGDAAESAKQYAYEAAKAGISANDYAEQAVSFGASLKDAFGGDTTRAAEAANTAIMDMADNAAKMGTPLENIQNAYQGFAKQNYTMLDNLKLGYGGTKSEMERLLADAQKISGVEYNIDNLGDVYDAIHVIQTDLGLTGVAADEAATTFSGSFGAMKAAASNLMANLALGESVLPQMKILGQSVKTFVIGNLLPMVGNIVKQIPSILAELPTFLADLLPDMIPVIGDMMTGLGQAIIDNIPKFIAGIGDLFNSMKTALTNIDWGSVASTFLTGLTTAIGSIWDSVTELLSVNFGIELPDWNTVVQDLTELWNNVKEAISGFFTAAFDILTDDDKTITEKISALWDLVKTSIGDMFKAVFDVALPKASEIIEDISNWWETNVWPTIQDFFLANFNIKIPTWSEIKERVEEFWHNFKSGIAGWFKKTFNLEIPTWDEIKEKVKTLWKDFKDGISGFFEKVFSVPMPSLDSIKEDITGLWEDVKKAIGDVFSWVFSLGMPDISGIVEDLKAWWGKIVETIGDFFTLKWILDDGSSAEEAAKTIVDEHGGISYGGKIDIGGDQVNVDSEAIQEALSNANLTLADVDTSSIDAAKEAVTTAVKDMESAFSNAKFSLPTVATTSLAAVSLILNAYIATWKNKMNFSWTLPTPHGYLPSFSVSMHEASSSDGSTKANYPVFSKSLQWFAKGGIFDAPTVIGVGDSPGPEAVVPLDMMWRQMGKELDEHAYGGNNFYFTINESENAERTAHEVAYILKKELRMA